MQTDYWNSLDYESQFRFINPRSIGVSSSIAKKGLDQLRTRIFEGASTVELGFMGKEKGSLSQGGITPEMHSKEDREELRQLAKINEVDLSTHTTVALGSVSGLGEGGFKPEIKERAIDEIKRTVDFAADVARGGPIVVHTGEFPRPIMEAKGFESYPGEEKRRIHYLVDSHTGDVIKTVREDEIIYEPEPMKGRNGKIVYQKNPDGSDKDIPEYALDKYGNMIVKPHTFTEFKNELKNELKKRGYSDEQIEKEAPMKFFEKQQLAEMEHAAGQAEQYEISYKRGLKQREMLTHQKKMFEENPEEAKRQIMQEMLRENPQLTEQNINKNIVNDIFEREHEKIDGQIREAEKEINYGREIAVSSRMQAKQREEIMKRAEPIEKFGVEQSADALARSAIYAYDKERTMKLEKPLFIAPENIFPESYGAAPQELKNLIVKSREVMAKNLQENRGISQPEANKIAADHIKATFDVGHANTWKKYFKGSDKDFQKWMTDQVENLQKEGIIGHVHLSDNFGYYDEHLAPGEGNVPIKQLTEKLEKYGYKGKFIAEWGAQPEAQSFRVMTGAWNTLSSPVYKLDPTSISWTDVEGSYFGRTGSPTYLVGDYAPSKDWTLWSETQLE